MSTSKILQPACLRCFGVCLFLVPVFAAPAPATPTLRTCSQLALPISSIGPAPTAYLEFCAANSGACAKAGAEQVQWSHALQSLISDVHTAVNTEIRFITDQEDLGAEEVWRYPIHGWGDCEDIALEKRRRLLSFGLPSAAMSMAIVHHRTERFSHALLLLETTRGTFSLDSLDAEVGCWDKGAFNFETRERQDGRWDRYDQSVWHHRSAATVELETASSACPG